MGNNSRPEREIFDTAIRVWTETGSRSRAAEAVGKRERTITDWIANAEKWFGVDVGRARIEAQIAGLRGAIDEAMPTQAHGFTAPVLPGGAPTIEELLARRRADFARKAEAHDARRLIPVKVNIDGPFGIGHFGDPHVDDDGTDIALIERHMRLFADQEGLFPATVGDIQNNWVGRLVRLWGEQSTSKADAAQLTEWFLSSLHWIYLIFGNHDDWNDGSALMRRMLSDRPIVAESCGARINLCTPSGRHFRVNARHNFPGNSQWNTAHGPAKAAQMGWRDHVLTCGHLHTSGYQVIKDPATGLISHAIRVAAYKTLDRYAQEMGLPDQTIFTCPVTIFDPSFADDNPRAVTTIFDPEEGADYLRFKRAHYSAGRRAS